MLKVIGSVKVAPGVVTHGAVLQVLQLPLKQAQLLICTVTLSRSRTSEGDLVPELCGGGRLVALTGQVSRIGLHRAVVDDWVDVSHADMRCRMELMRLGECRW